MINKPELLSLTEQQDLEQTIKIFDEQITDEIYNRAEFYEVEEDEDTLLVTAKLFDAEGNQLISIDVEDYDAAEEVLADMFDLDDIEDYDEHDYQE